MYLQFRSISPHSFEKKIGLSNGYFKKQLRNLGSVGSDILIKIDSMYTELDILWVLTGQRQMITPPSDYLNDTNSMHVDEFMSKYEAENRKMKTLESDVEKLQVVLKDKDKIISLYEVITSSKINSASPDSFSQAMPNQ
ncbi:MAG: hypothetical protein NTY43_02655 [Bacteroidetes bacterium]|nr:hypothetical protein [Bacteroidota bacterium]